MRKLVKRRVWLDVWSSDLHVEGYIRYHTASNIVALSTPNQDCIGGGIELLSKTFEARYDSWYRRLYVSLWFFACWLNLPRMNMLAKFYEDKKEREKV